MTNKTLIGKDYFLFLINDSNKEILNHAEDFIVSNKEYYLNLKQVDNHYLIIFPDKSVVLQKFLPEEYKEFKRRNLVDYIVEFLEDKCIDTYKFLRNYPPEEIFYKTDTHMNLNGCYIVYQYINKLFKLENNLDKDIYIENKKVNNLCSIDGYGDLLWKSNCGDLQIKDTSDTYYFSDTIPKIYLNNIENIKLQGINLKILSKISYEDKTSQIKNIDWNVISENIIYSHYVDVVEDEPFYIIFYDSFLLSTLGLYMRSLRKCYFIKEVYSNKYIQKLQTYGKIYKILEFRVERFLNK